MSTQFEEKKFLQELETSMQKRLEQLGQNFSSIRTNKAMPNMLDSVIANIVDASGNNVSLSLNRFASITVADERTLVVNVWETKNVKSAERAIAESKLGLTPMSEGNIIRATLPTLSGERRQELIKLVGDYAEKGRIEVRNVRSSALKSMKDAKLSQDLAKRMEKQVQNITDKYIEEIEKKLSQKKLELSK